MHYHKLVDLGDNGSRTIVWTGPPGDAPALPDGFKLLSIGNAAGVLDALQRQGADAVLIADLELLKQLRPSVNDTPLLFVGYDAQARLEAIATGADEFTVYAGDARQLAERIETQLAFAQHRAMAGDALRRSEERYRSLTEAIASIVWTADEEGRFVEPQPSWQAYTGQTWEQARGFGWADALHADDRDRIWNDWQTSHKVGRLVNTEGRLWFAPAGTYHHFEVRALPIRDRRGAVREWIGTCIDREDQKQAEQALRRSEQTYRAIGESIQYGVWICEPDGRNIYASDSFLKLVGRTQEECSDFGWGSVLHPDDAERTVAAWKECVRTGGTWDMEHRFRGVDGKYHWVLARGVPVRDETGEIVCWAGINLDIDQVKAGAEILRAHERGLRAANEALTRANQDLRQFAFAASHDLQEPLRMITAYSQLLIRAVKEGQEEQAEFAAQVITEGTERSRELLSDLLAYTRLSGAEEDPAQLVDLNATMTKVVENLKTPISDAGATITSDELPAVMGHEVHFLQLFQNLVENALKYRGGNPPKIHATAGREGGKWCISVSDNGIGIDPQYHQKIFGVFKRLHGKNVPGTGIGLAICQRVVERYGGRIWVESEPGRGSAFRFTLPEASGQRGARS